MYNNQPSCFVFCFAHLVSEKRKTLKASGLHRLNKFLASNKTSCLFIFCIFPHIFFFSGQQRDLNNRLNCNTLSVHWGTWNGIEGLLLRAFCHNRRSGRAKKISACSWRKACHCLTCRRICGSNMNGRGCACRTSQLRSCSTPGLICQAKQKQAVIIIIVVAIHPLSRWFMGSMWDPDKMPAECDSLESNAEKSKSKKSSSKIFFFFLTPVVLCVKFCHIMAVSAFFM